MESMENSNPFVDIYEEMEKFIGEYSKGEIPVNTMEKKEEKEVHVPLKERKEMKDLFGALGNCGMKKEQEQFRSLVDYTENMEKQFGNMLKEMQEIRQELGNIQNRHAAGPITLLVNASESSLKSAQQSLYAWKHGLTIAAGNAVRSFQQHGKNALQAAVNKMGIPKALSFLHQEFGKAKAKAYEDADKFAMIREELYQGKSHMKNAGRAFMGKETGKEADHAPEKGILYQMERKFRNRGQQLEKMQEATHMCMRKTGYYREEFNAKTIPETTRRKPKTATGR